MSTGDSEPADALEPTASGRRPRRPRPPRLGPLAIALGFALVTLTALLAFAWHEYEQATDEQRARVELLARVLAHEGTHALDSASAALGTLAQTLPQMPPGRNALSDAALRQTLNDVPSLKALAVLDLQGRIVAGNATHTNVRAIDLGRLPVPATAGEHRLGPMMPGSSLDALAIGGPAPSAAAAGGSGFLPLVLRAHAPAGGDWLLVGLVSPDAIADEQMPALEPLDAAAFISHAGQVLATAGGAPAAGTNVATLPLFSGPLSRSEKNSLVGPGLRDGTQVIGFHALQRWPLVAVVERSRSDVRAAWLLQLAWFAMPVALFLAALAALANIAVRESRARAEARRLMAARERELSVIVRSVQELLVRTDAEGCITFVNPRWQAATGLPAEALVGKPLTDLVDNGSRGAVRSLFRPGGPEEGLRMARIALGPQRRRFELALLPLSSGERRLGYAGSAIDITERESAEQRLQSQLAFNELLVQGMPLPVSVLDLDARYVTVNAAWEEFTGRRRSDVIGRRARDYVAAEEAVLNDRRDRAALERGAHLRYEAQVMHRDGSRRDIALTKAVLPGPDGEPAGVLVTMMDVSEFRDAERAIREARDVAEEASRAKSEFIANISHELRTPLQSIIGFSELGQVRGSSNPKLAGMFQDIHEAGQRMLALVNDLLDVSKIESTVGTFHLERADVRVLVREVARELEPLLTAKRLHLALDLCEAPLISKVDPMRFQQVVRNVLANAVRFSPADGTIELSGDIDGEHLVHLAIRDHGPGIPPAELEKIFEAFVQSSKTKDGSGGTGLGLAICRKIVEAHGGRIGADNAPGGGSVFHIRLPARSSLDTVTQV